MEENLYYEEYFCRGEEPSAAKSVQASSHQAFKTIFFYNFLSFYSILSPSLRRSPALILSCITVTASV